MPISRLLVLGFVLTVGCLANVGAEHPLCLADMTESEAIEFTKLQPHMDKLALELARLTNEPPTNVEAQIAAARSIAKHLNPSAEYGSKKFLLKAAKLFASLEDAADECGLKNFNILSRNYLALSEDRNSNERLHETFQHYSQKYAQKCRPELKQNYAEQVKKVSGDDMKKIKKNFNSLKSAYFGIQSKLDPFVDPLVMRRPDFTSRSARHARHNLAINIARQAMQTSRWATLMGAKNQPEEYEEMLTKVLDEYLLNPCKNFHKQLNNILTPARFVSAVFEKERAIDDEFDQYEYIHGDEEFYEAMINNRYCASLLASDKSRLYKLLIDSWKSISFKIDMTSSNEY